MYVCSICGLHMFFLLPTHLHTVPRPLSGTGAIAEEEEDYDKPEEAVMDASVAAVSHAPAQQAPAAPELLRQPSPAPASQPPTSDASLSTSAVDNMSVAPPQPQALAPPTQPTVPEATQPSEELYEKVKKLFPSFRREGLLRFSSLLGLGRPSCLPKIWAGARKPKRKKLKQEPQDGWEGEDRSEHWTLDLGGTPPRELLASDDEDWLLSGADDHHSQKGAGRKRGRSGGRKCAWRHGPAKYWYDQLNVPEDGSNFDYGFKLKVC